MATMDQELPPLIQRLLEARRYPEAARQVELIQTHISWVLLAGDFAYKIKKPLKLPFLDFSTLELRRLCCLDELRLNQRVAPDLYLEVVGIFNTPRDPRFDGLGAPIEYAVKMRRFDQDGRLDRVCDRGELDPRQLSDLAGSLVDFHDNAAVAGPDSDFGSPSAVLAPALDNFRDLAVLLQDAAIRGRLAALRAWTEAQFSHLGALMQARKLAGRVRECHGDLHLANLVLIDARVRMFDCIEFNADLRWIDVANDIAFTYVDLLDHGQPGLANWLLNEVLCRSGDYESAQVLRFYAVYRAMVRAKVALIGARQTVDNQRQCETYIAIAERLVAPRPPRLLITFGLAGCGKTWASRQLLLADPDASMLRLRSDLERRRLFGLAATERSGSAMEAGIYAPQANQRTYAHLRDMARTLLRSGWSVIVDAAFLKRGERDSFRSLAVDCGAGFGILAPQATPQVLRERIQARLALGNDASEATLEVLDQQMRWIEPLDPAEIGQVIAWDATRA